MADVRAGFRLVRLEVYNWGTLHQRVWGLDCHGDNALLTGDIGSGKSTLVDAMTTLLVAPQKITYNKAAGADAGERRLRTYVLGYYKSERGDAGSAAKPVALRGYNDYSVILSRFVNEQLDQTLTLAQVFWWKDTQGQPARFYVAADRELSIGEHFSGFGKEIERLRKRLRATASVELFDSFPPYAAAYRRRMGIANEQAMDLFYQTVSMKSVGNLTEFVRAHMLEAFAADERIQALIQHFDDLTRAHEAVLKAKRQIERLTPLVGDCERHTTLAVTIDESRACRDALAAWFADLKGALLDDRVKRLRADVARVTERFETLSRRRSEDAEKCDRIKDAIRERGGERIATIEAEIAAKRAERDHRARQANRYAELVGAVDLPSALDAESFHANRERISAKRGEIEPRKMDAQNALTEAAVAMRVLRDEHSRHTTELESLRRRRSNIPARMLGIRDRLVESLDLDEADIPFAGELIQVRSSARLWEGAVERLMHGFGLSLLVSEADYPRVAAWVDRNHLSERLVYFRTRDSATVGQVEMDEQSAAAKIELNPRSPFFPWLEREVARRFDHRCCASTDELRRVQRGLTRAGQIKSGGERHEKDDRHAIDDRTHYVLGWSNESKIAALEKVASDTAERGTKAAALVMELEDRVRALDEYRTTLGQLDVYDSFREIDWESVALEIERLDEERRQLESASDVLQTLRAQLDAAVAELRSTEKGCDEAIAERSKLEERQSTALQEHGECAAQVAAMPEATRERYFPELDAMRHEALGDAVLTIESSNNRQQEMRTWLQKRIDADTSRLKTLGERIVSAMRDYIHDYPVDAREVDAAVESASEFAVMLTRLQSDELPKFEGRFKRLLNENTIREVANFQSQLNRERQTIGERIARINQSLKDIDYNPGRFIALEAVSNADVEVRDFQLELRACTDGTLTGSEDDAYSEAKFLQVRRIIERFRGREGLTEADQRWTRKVTDVRNWFVFSASERWKEDGTEHEHYTDSGGKSGGQKEKLAYTVLAASLAYQFGIDSTVDRPRTFRFVVIDEAFGRGSDESARYGLELFKRLNLQLLVVTPLQKIHIIEPYVAAVGFVHNPDGNSSMLRNLTIEEYRAERAAAAVSARGASS